MSTFARAWDEFIGAIPKPSREIVADRRPSVTVAVLRYVMRVLYPARSLCYSVATRTRQRIELTMETTKCVTGWSG
jgi:hypothetical protein